MSGPGDRTRRMSATVTAAATAETSSVITAGGIDAHLDALQAIANRSDGTRAAGTAGSEATVAYIVTELRAAGWRARTQALRVPVFLERSKPRLTVAGRRVAAV